jgi:hypothetical protein
VREEAFIEGARPGIPRLVARKEAFPSTLNLRLSPLRKLAHGVASAIRRTKGVNQGVRAGNWIRVPEDHDLTVTSSLWVG